jgi:hypothetical protein
MDEQMSTSSIEALVMRAMQERIDRASDKPC